MAAAALRAAQPDRRNAVYRAAPAQRDPQHDRQARRRARRSQARATAAGPDQRDRAGADDPARARVRFAQRAVVPERLRFGDLDAAGAPHHAYRDRLVRHAGVGGPDAHAAWDGRPPLRRLRGKRDVLAPRLAADLRPYLLAAAAMTMIPQSFWRKPQPVIGILLVVAGWAVSHQVGSD